MPHETIEWHDVKEQMPDSDTTVLICVPASDEPVWLGWFDGETWYSVDAIEQLGVTMWADMPIGSGSLVSAVPKDG